jgi:two-component system alkaline phosphatase synthesis response regulator PhoP
MIKVAIIEDDLNLRSMYTFKLEQAGFIVKTANDGQEGLELVKEFNPDIVLLDLMMPLMSGDEMLAHMRAEDWGASTRVIILTNISKDEAPQALRFLHVDRYIVKAHYTPTQVLEVVREVLHIK